MSNRSKKYLLINMILINRLYKKREVECTRRVILELMPKYDKLDYSTFTTAFY